VPVLTVKQAAAGVGLTQWAIYRVIQRGELIAYKPCGRLRIREEDLDAWLESTKVTAEARAAARRPAMLPPNVYGHTVRMRSADASLRDRVRAERSKRRGT
jgi:excisionase family DNA binding protein